MEERWGLVGGDAPNVLAVNNPVKREAERSAGTLAELHVDGRCARPAARAVAVVSTAELEPETSRWMRPRYW